MSFRTIPKRILQGVFIVLTFPYALASGFGRFGLAYTFFAHLYAIIPGIMGDYCRSAYYTLTLRQCTMSSRISFGTIVAHSRAVVSRGVYIGAYCVLGNVRIGERTQIASHVQILSGRHQHARDERGRILGSDEEEFGETLIGCDCWIGASAVVMADVGAGSTVGAGAVVTTQIPPGVIAVGNPARVVKPAHLSPAP